MNAVVEIDYENPALPTALKESIYPGAPDDHIRMVMDYCKAQKLDPLQKPVHLVGMWDSKARSMRTVVMPGINLYRVQAARSGEYGGVDEAEFGPAVTQQVGHAHIKFPEWCRVTVYRIVNGNRVPFTAKEYWLENYAAKGGPEKDQSPNSMWTKRIYGQLAKCTEAQALRKAFPELCAGYTAEEMDGKEIVGHEPQRKDNGNTVSGEHQQLINDKQVRHLRNLFEQGNFSEEAFCKKVRIENIEDLEASRFAGASMWLHKQIAQKQEVQQ